MAEMAADERHLGGETGALMVLHTWDQMLDHHPHVHCVAPGGVWSPAGRWIEVQTGKKRGRRKKAPGMARWSLLTSQSVRYNAGSP